MTYRWPTCNVRRLRSLHGAPALPERLRYPATSALRQALAAAVAWELIEENPAKKAGKNPQPKAREIRPLTGEELGRVVGELGGAHGSLVTFAAETGLRPCEWLALERRDIDKACTRAVRRA